MSEYTEMHKRVVKGYLDVRDAIGDWPKQSQVAKHLNVSHGTVSKAVRELNGLGQPVAVKQFVVELVALGFETLVVALPSHAV